MFVFLPQPPSCLAFWRSEPRRRLYSCWVRLVDCFVHGVPLICVHTSRANKSPPSTTQHATPGGGSSQAAARPPTASKGRKGKASAPEGSAGCACGELCLPCLPLFTHILHLPHQATVGPFRHSNPAIPRHQGCRAGQSREGCSQGCQAGCPQGWRAGQSRKGP